jgi:hypothetical protein
VSIALAIASLGISIARITLAISALATGIVPLACVEIGLVRRGARLA